MLYTIELLILTLNRPGFEPGTSSSSAASPLGHIPMLQAMVGFEPTLIAELPEALYPLELSVRGARLVPVSKPYLEGLFYTESFLFYSAFPY